MKITCMSDLHFEFERRVKPDNSIQYVYDRLFEMMEPFEADVLILAGDIHTKGRVDFVNQAAERYRHVLYICGNHEYYGGHLNFIPDSIRRHIKMPNAHFLERETIELDGVRFHGTTLWTSINNANPIDMMRAEGGMNDFVRIGGLKKHQTGTLVWLYMHHESVRFLRKNIQPGDVVITHHAPSLQCIDEYWKCDPLNPAYCSDLDDLILDTKPGLWFHGHMHTCQDLQIGETRVIRNPRGYLGDRVPEFNPRMVVEI